MNVRAIVFGAALAGALAGAAPAGAGSSIVVGNVWSRPATTTAVVYMSIRNGGSSGDSLIGVSSPAARHAELHESTSSGGSMAGMPATAPMVSMKSVASAPVPAGGQLVLQPGGYHIMLIGLSAPWKLGNTFLIRLHFKHAGWISTNGIVSGQ
jgi:copper(I)-binding protein